MDFFKKLKKAKGGYIFLSHSHADIDKVRQIRNRLEEDGFEPLCFYLKCLNDDSEIEELIKREIDAREWFLFANSVNAQKSKWVTLEREYITRTNKKKILTVDINDESAVDAVLHKIKHHLRVVISYSLKDGNLASRVKGAFEKKDYQVFLDGDRMTAGSVFFDDVSSAIVEASKSGCVAVLLTEHSMRSELVAGEVALALEQGGNVIPVFVGKADLDNSHKIWGQLARHCGVFLPEHPTENELERMVDSIGRMIVDRPN